ncbi:MAG: HAD-IB family hydrolase [Haliea sp.]|uniref:HAD-IB family hydrolase n=1 Tax=Haliea sp. TaxID=1932666 RepID=UPI000C603D7F|nr:HAD-IB family hydrolase [Haliea sp.]MBM70646.1 HAD-IB family hydrolase [Haliea sp.]|tara:strand:+ start:44568 stop:46280 length:1713 start_codon:yes stop_codon:yes gene_type:complete
MASVQQLLRDIAAAPDGPAIAAIFDFDGTIISGYSATSFIREQLRRGDLQTRELLELAQAMTSFGLGNLGFSAMMTVTTQFLRGITEASYEDLGETLYNDQLARRIYPESRALINAHLAKGHTVAVISSATPYQVVPAARDLGIEHVMCTELEVEDGLFTGQVIRPTCFGQGKVDAAERLAGEQGADLDQSFFYSDSHDDLLLLERVGLPRVLNPNTRLLGIARDRHWPVARFSSRGRPSLSLYLRSAAATVSLVPTFLAGLPVYALTRSKRQSLNFSLSLFADTASALIGLDLNVKGKQHLWSHRPAVFIFNHQSKADVVVIASLLRADMAGVGKKEIRDMPVIGRVLETAGVVMIDRANSASAIEAMTPLVEAMRDEGKSVVLAPEGTRSVSPRLGPFKKGAFHLAMQAGVPIIPIVIRNAGDVAPKGEFVFRPATVDVEVLEPIDTSNWQVSDLNEHIREVRNRMLAVLGQPLEPAEKAASVTAKRPNPAKTKAKTKSKAKAKAGTKTPTKKKVATAKKTAARKKTASTGTKVAAKATPKAAAVRKRPPEPRPKARPKSRADTVRDL